MMAYALNVAKDIKAREEPSTYKEAINFMNSKKWVMVMYKEMESLQKNSKWELVKLSKGNKAV